jgi:hypothetical protein
MEARRWNAAREVAKAYHFLIVLRDGLQIFSILAYL